MFLSLKKISLMYCLYEYLYFIFLLFINCYWCYYLFIIFYYLFGRLVGIFHITEWGLITNTRRFAISSSSVFICARCFSIRCGGGTLFARFFIGVIVELIACLWVWLVSFSSFDEDSNCESSAADLITMKLLFSVGLTPFIVNQYW